MTREEINKEYGDAVHNAKMLHLAECDAADRKLDESIEKAELLYCRRLSENRI